MTASPPDGRMRRLSLPLNAGHLFSHHAAARPDATAIVQGRTTLSFSELDTRCNGVANGLRRTGVRYGDRVAVLMANDFRFVEVLFGAMRLGAIPVPLAARASDETLASVLHDSEAAALIADAPQAERAVRLSASTGSGLPVVAPDVADDPRQRLTGYESWVRADAHPAAAARVCPTDACLMPYTSGSTGRPKGVVLTHVGQIWNASTLAALMELDETDRALVFVPMAHKNAMIGIIKPVLFAGGTVVILPAFDPLEAIRTIERQRITYLTGVPAMFAQILDQREVLARHDVRSVRYAGCGSAAVPPRLLSELSELFGAPVVEGYGLTEGGPVPIAHRRRGPHPSRSCGRPLPGGSVRLVDESGGEVGPGRAGELLVKNPGVTTGYWKRPELTQEKLRDGWLKTGDLMRRDSDGFYYFVGRLDDRINVAGEKVYPLEVEEVLRRHPGLRDACVVRLPDETRGEVPVAFVTESSPGGTTADEVKQFYLDRAAAYAHPRHVHVLASFPVTATGKPDRRALELLARRLWRSS